MKRIPRGFNFWPKQETEKPIREIVELYTRGFAGVYLDDQASERYRAEVQDRDGETIAHDSGFADSGAGKLVVPFLLHENTFPGCWPGAAQARGDCVSHSTKNAGLLSLICEIIAAQPDEVTGRIEGIPELSATAIKQGALSTEAIYWWRRHGGDGWSCDHAASVLSKESGLWLRKDYPELGFSLEKYSGSLAGKWGRSPPGPEVAKIGQEHLVRKVTSLNSADELRDFLFNGYGVSSCGSEGFSDQRNEDGVASRRGSWSHAMAYLGFDDRDSTKQKYNGPLVLVQNSWAIWNGGPRKIMGTNFEIPEGAFWARWSDLSRRSMHAFSSVAGWPARRRLQRFLSPVG